MHFLHPYMIASGEDILICEYFQELYRINSHINDQESDHDVE